MDVDYSNRFVYPNGELSYVYGVINTNASLMFLLLHYVFLLFNEPSCLPALDRDVFSLT